MKYLSTLVVCLLAAGCAATVGEAPAASDGYGSIAPTRDGIGKTYMGREIADVMGHEAADWLERSTRDAEEATDRLVRYLELEPTDVVADIGAGTGYFAFRISRFVSQGKVLAVDIQPEMLDFVREKARREAVTNVEPVLGTIEDPNLPAGGVDLVLMVDAYHEFSHPREMMKAILAGLKPGGRVVLVEYRLEDPTVPIKRLHKMSEAQARREMEASGLEFVENKDVLPRQHFLVFRKPTP